MARSKKSYVRMPNAEYATDLHSLDKKYIHDLAQTFFMRVLQTSKFLRVCRGDVLLVDLSLKPHPGDLVVAHIVDSLVLGIYSNKNGHNYLLPFGKKLGGENDVQNFLWGVVYVQITRGRRSRSCSKQ